MMALATSFARYSLCVSDPDAIRTRFIRILVNFRSEIICVPLVTRVSSGTHVSLAISARGSDGYSRRLSSSNLRSACRV
jgi:hypothetical protein